MYSEEYIIYSLASCSIMLREMEQNTIIHATYIYFIADDFHDMKEMSLSLRTLSKITLTAV